MSRLSDIPVRVVHDTPDNADNGYMIGTVLPLMHELAAMLEALVTAGEVSSIDLRRTPLGPKDHQALREMLGQGEVSAVLNALGPTRIEETAVSGLWWVTHFNQDDQVVGEFIEVTACPDLFKAHEEELRGGPEQLRSRIASFSRETDPVDLAARVDALGIRPRNSATNFSFKSHSKNRG